MVWGKSDIDRSLKLPQKRNELRMNPFRKTATFLLGTPFKRTVSHYDINCVLDVGANYSQYGTMLRKTGCS